MNAIVDGFKNIVQSLSDAIFLAVIKDDRYQYLLDGLKMSLLLTVIAAGIGVVIGMLLAIAKLQDLDNLSGSRFMNGLRRWLAGFANGYISGVRGTPAVVQLMVIYFIIFGRLFQGVLEGYQVAALAFGINSGAYVGVNDVVESRTSVRGFGAHRKPSYKILDQSLGYARIDAIHRHLVTVICSPSESEFR